MPSEPLPEVVTSTEFPSTDAMRCPYGFYEALREDAPVHRLPSGREYVVSRYEDIVAVTRDPELFSNHHTVTRDGWMTTATLDDHLAEGAIRGINASDPPEHTWKRKLAFEMFKPGRLREREPMIRSYADALIDTFAGAGEVEFVGQFATPLPVEVILTMFGLPLDHYDRALRWGHFDGMGTRWNTEEVQADARESILDLQGFLEREVQLRVDEPGDDDLSRHVQRHIELRGEVDVPEIVAETFNLFVGGMITTTHLMANMMMLLTSVPERMERVYADHGLLKNAIREALRVESPVQFSPRLVTRDTELGGVPIEAGSIVLLLWGSANRDERIYECPAEFDLDRREAKGSMAFGHGAHFCLGAPLSRLEAQIAFERLLTRLPNIRLAEGRNDFSVNPTVTFRAQSQLFLEFDPEAR